MLSEKQREYRRNATHRWNIKTGATRSGKTYGDYLLLPKRLMAGHGKEGFNVILGNTRGTLSRNVIEPMQELYGTRFVSKIHSDSTAEMFGEKVYCLGADSKTHQDRIRGMSIKYCYGDEITTWNEEVFTMLQSRLDKPYSIFDGTCNPEGSHHWFRKFLTGKADIYEQKYCIDDNPYLDPMFVENLKREYEGTVYYDRYILGEWVAAEGAIYRRFADNKELFVVDDIDPREIIFAEIGVDFGGGSSRHAFCCVGYTDRYEQKIILDEYCEQDALDPKTLEDEFCSFVIRNKQKYRITEAFCDSAEQTLINGLRQAVGTNGIGINVRNALKKSINDRIRCDVRLMGRERLKVLKHCTNIIEAFSTAVWKDHGTKDERLDDGTYNVDILDAQEYATERHMKELIDYRPYSRVDTLRGVNVVY